MTQRHSRALLRQPYFLAITLTQPIIWLLLFGALFKSVTEIPGFAAGGSYLDYLMPGVVVMTALFSSGWSGMGIIEDMDRGLMDRFLVGADASERADRRAGGLRGRQPRPPVADHRRAGLPARRPVRGRTARLCRPRR